MSNQTPPDLAEELAVLFPDVDVQVRDPETGERVTLEVREFRFLEGLRAQALARPFTGALAALIADRRFEEIDAALIAEVMASQAEAWVRLVALACDREPEWVSALADADGDALSEAMWSANGRFFTRRVVASVAARERKEPQSGSQKSSTRSSREGTDAGTPTLPGG